MGSTKILGGGQATNDKRQAERAARVQTIRDGARVRRALSQSVQYEHVDGEHVVVFRGRRLIGPTLDAVIKAAGSGRRNRPGDREGSRQGSKAGPTHRNRGRSTEVRRVTTFCTRPRPARPLRCRIYPEETIARARRYNLAAEATWPSGGKLSRA